MYTSELNFKNLNNSANAFVSEDDLFVKLHGILDRLKNPRQERKMGINSKRRLNAKF